MALDRAFVAIFSWWCRVHGCLTGFRCQVSGVRIEHSWGRRQCRHL